MSNNRDQICDCQDLGDGGKISTWYVWVVPRRWSLRPFSVEHKTIRERRGVRATVLVPHRRRLATAYFALQVCCFKRKEKIKIRVWWRPFKSWLLSKARQASHGRWCFELLFFSKLKIIGQIITKWNASCPLLQPHCPSSKNKLVQLIFLHTRKYSSEKKQKNSWITFFFHVMFFLINYKKSIAHILRNRPCCIFCFLHKTNSQKRFNTVLQNDWYSIRLAVD